MRTAQKLVMGRWIPANIPATVPAMEAAFYAGGMRTEYRIVEGNRVVASIRRARILSKSW